ncbi:hypothetical protein PENSPDRAFT_584810 [Peniophora sp. CONT]|nr:hypothetical protein PENSPDRAFT_584810 [Peniophora sp. CONT]
MTTPAPLRKKGPKNLPTLPLSAFSPPNSGVSENFPLPPSPSTVHPDRVVDASVRAIPQWKKECTGAIEGRVKEIVAVAPEGGVDSVLAQASEAGVDILAIQIPFKLEDGALPELPSANVRITLKTTFTSPSESAVQALQAAVKAGHVVDLHIEGDGGAMDESWEGLEELLTKATEAATIGEGAIVLENILPPPHDLELPIVKLLTHPSYQSYQSHVAALSLIPNTYAKFLPPDWNAPTPHTPAPGATLSPENNEDKQKKEWKRRIKMYLGPAVEAFGFERIIFGSAPSPTSRATSSAGDWYDIARESFAELGVDQETVDGIFGNNAKRVYGARS